MKKKDLLDFLGNKFYCRVKPSKIEGVGVFAIKDIYFENLENINTR